MRTTFIAAVLLACVLVLGRVAGAADLTLTIDGRSEGRMFEGIGALSAGASSRLLMEYPEPQRSRILDFLFQPNFGASLHHLKVEIGGDVNSTDGTEPSHARTREEFEHPRPEYYDRGYEWWLMREAKKRDPRIMLDILQWGAPPWIGGTGDPRKKFYSQDNADFIAAFIHGAKKHHHLDIDYCGIWNERLYDAPWIKLLRTTLDRQGLSRVKIIAADDCMPNTRWNIAKDVLADRALANAVAVIGEHYPQCRSTPEAVRTGKPLWSSEDGPWRGDWSGACILAKAYNRNYIQGKMTKTVNWSLISSYYAMLPLPNSGLMMANQPWSGHYEVQPAIWAAAHTTQFTQPGWKYLDGACRLLKDGSMVALRSPEARGDYSLIVETVDAKAPQTLALRLDGGLSGQPLHVWRTNPRSQFEQLADLKPADGGFTMTFEPGAIYTLTTTTGQRKGQADIPQPADFPCPYSDDFESYSPGTYAKYFSDQAGLFEVVKRPDGKGQCLRQVVNRKGIEWQPMFEPYSLLGSTKWRNYEVAADARAEQGGEIALYGRVVSVAQTADPPQGYIFKVNAEGRWRLQAAKRLLAQGRVPFAADQWHRLKLAFSGPQITVSIDGTEVSVDDYTFTGGMAAVGCGWNCAMFDNFAIRPLAARASGDLAESCRATASSTWSEEYDARLAVDGNGQSRWSAAPGKTDGEWLQVDFGKKTRFDLVSVHQFQDRITQYKIQYDAGGGWRDAFAGDTQGQSHWVARFASVEAQKVRLQIVATRGNHPTKDPPSVFTLEVYDSSRASSR